MKLTAMLALGGFASLMITAPTAAAAPPCSASGLANTASGVLAQAGGYLDAHPDANDVLTAAGSQPTDEAERSVRAYFVGHPGEFLDLQNIARPLTSMRGQCGTSVSPGQLATLFNALS
ncbi:heme-binding protein [Mycobacterium sp. OTB74]|jgi:hemophore-related protein|uniref:heme-binding protein n=1 Tax=Mycobacterium sp. OTB74 TaxID=1853452 RepID=UPI00247438B3|nr:heme-binding protein [Mycobacterium sp. OTB74]MDH6245917.1 hemophore-related protein [Mycobacterium sp. OTB74]